MIKNMNYINEVKNIIAEKSGVNVEEINEDSFFEDDLNLSNLEVVEILGDLEESYEIEGLLEQKDEIETVGDLLDLLSDHVE
jgi:acyl carrier protein